jgi:L-ascorbate metabolism protein UlaG (beta-lactamase superfamily)
LIGIYLNIKILPRFPQTHVITKYVSNEKLKTVNPDWLGTPVDENGRFVNHEFPFKQDFFKLLKWQLGPNPQAKEKREDTARLEVFDPTDFLQSETDGILWLGHASFFIRLNGIGILLDPVFGEPPFLKRFVDVPSPIEKLKKVDYILVSHDHRDHADKETIKKLAHKFSTAKILVGLGMEDLIDAWKTPDNEVQTAGWYQQFETANDVNITFVPVRHWARRGLTDMNKRLWGGFVIQSKSVTIYFSGDTGYGSHFKELAAVFPGIDYFIVGIGAYAPDFVMQSIHQNPSEAWQSFLDSGAKYLIPMHYGTFDLTNEPPSEPLRLLFETAEKFGAGGKIKALKINENIDL